MNAGVISFSVLRQRAMKSALDMDLDLTPFNFSINLSVGRPLSSVPKG